MCVVGGGLCMGVRHVLVLGAMGYDGFAGDMWVGGGAWWAGCGTLWVVVGVRVCRVCLLCGGRWLAGVVWLVTCVGRWVAGGGLRMGGLWGCGWWVRCGCACWVVYGPRVRWMGGYVVG